MMMMNMNRLVALSKSSSTVGRVLAYQRTFAAATSGDDDSLIKTALYDLHKELGGDMVPFAGYSLPVLYKGLGVMKEHLWCRSDGKSSLFDVSHMGQVRTNNKLILEYRTILHDIIILSKFLLFMEWNVIFSLCKQIHVYRLNGMERIVWNFWKRL